MTFLILNTLSISIIIHWYTLLVLLQSLLVIPYSDRFYNILSLGIFASAATTRGGAAWALLLWAAAADLWLLDTTAPWQQQGRIGHSPRRDQ